MHRPRVCSITQWWSQHIKEDGCTSRSILCIILIKKVFAFAFAFARFEHSLRVTYCCCRSCCWSDVLFHAQVVPDRHVHAPCAHAHVAHVTYWCPPTCREQWVRKLNITSTASLLEVCYAQKSTQYYCSNFHQVSTVTRCWKTPYFVTPWGSTAPSHQRRILDLSLQNRKRRIPYIGCWFFSVSWVIELQGAEDSGQSGLVLLW